MVCVQVEVEVEDQRPTAQRLTDALAALPPPTPSRVLQVSVLQGRNPLYCGCGANVCISLINISIVHSNTSPQILI